VKPGTLKSGKRTFAAVYRGPDKKEHSKSFARKVDAERYITEQEGHKLKGDWIDPAKAKVPYAQWLEIWQAGRIDIRSSTVQQNADYLRLYVLPTFGTVPIGVIDKPMVRAWVAAMTRRKVKATGKTFAPSTVRKAEALLSQSLQAAVEERWIPHNPCRGVTLPADEDTEMAFFTATEIKALADAIDPRYRTFVLLGAASGLRPGELAALEWDKVDLLKGVITVSKTLSERGGYIETGPPKTASSKRQVRIPKSIVKELEAHMKQWKGKDTYVFTSPEGGPMRGNFRSRIWKKAVEKIGRPEATPHALRHSAIALWIHEGANIMIVSKRAGHKSVAFTLDRYGHLYPEADEALLVAMDAVFAAGTNGPSGGGDGPQREASA